MLLIVFALTALASDWDSCADALNRLRHAARNATDKANDVKAKYDEFENCKNYPEIYDYMRDRCRSKASEYRNAVSDLESELSTVSSRIKSVQYSCGYDFGASTSRLLPGKETSGNRLCDLLRSYKGEVPFDDLMNACLKSLSKTDCQKCLGEK